jgi:hypothetical protein
MGKKTDLSARLSKHLGTRSASRKPLSVAPSHFQGALSDAKFLDGFDLFEQTDTKLCQICWAEFKKSNIY